MSKQLKTPSLTGSSISIWFDAVWNEYQVRIAGKPKATYHTESKRDALQTAQTLRNKFCLPVENPPGETLAVPTVAELVDFQIRPTRVFAFATQLTQPAGWWVNAADGEIIRRVRGLRYGAAS